MTPARLTQRLQDLLGPAGLLCDAAAGLVYAHDASHLSLGRPLAVALPETLLQLQEVVRLCAAAGVALVPRGSGTGLSGGAVPPEGAVVLGCGRLQSLGQAARGRIRSEAGVLNEQVSAVAGPGGYSFAPDPSSQSAASIGGNIATNAGGPHCLRHGVTLQHLANLEWISARGDRWGTGRGVGDERGLDLASLLCGSEGTLGVIGAATLKLVPLAEDVATLLAFFPRLDEATGAVVQLLGAGLLPVAVEMVDQPMLQAVEQAFGFGFPTDVAAAMITEFSGSTSAVAEDARRAQLILQEAGAREVRLAVDEAERGELWKCRKKAFGAVGRLAPSYVTMDVVVPLGSLPDFVAEIQTIKARHGVDIATAFHAGDGNLHPGVHYDDRDEEASRRAHKAADEIITAALAHGGSATGEHGVGLEKIHALPWQLDRETGRLHHRIKEAFDPAGLLNPGKLLPSPEAVYAALPLVPTGVRCRHESLTVTAPGTARLSELQAAAAEYGLWLPVGLPGSGVEFGLGYDPTVGELLDHLAVGPTLLGTGTTRDYLLESWAETGDGRVFHSGAPVFKNVAGYDLHHMLCGSGGVFVRHLAATFQLRPRPEQVLPVELTAADANLSGLASLWAWLAARAHRLAAPLAVVDLPAGALVLVPGRDRPWDLGQVAAELRDCLTPGGWQVATRPAIPFAAAATVLKGGFLPDWALGSPDWTSAVSQPAGSAGTGDLRLARFVSQGRPERLWLPGPAPVSSDWLADEVVRGGAVSLPPAPGAEVPREIVAHLKRIFDPGQALPRPEWLAGGGAL